MIVILSSSHDTNRGKLTEGGSRKKGSLTDLEEAWPQTLLTARLEEAPQFSENDATVVIITVERYA